jgi:hypothetical protein
MPRSAKRQLTFDDRDCARAKLNAPILSILGGESRPTAYECLVDVQKAMLAIVVADKQCTPYRAHEIVYNPWHYVAALERNPGALNTAPAAHT